MPKPDTYAPKIAKGNMAMVFTYDTGGGYFFVNRIGQIDIECWGRGGDGAIGDALGGGGGGAGGYVKKSVSIPRGSVIAWSISAGGDCSVTASAHSINLTANHGNPGSGSSGGLGGSASGGSVNNSGQSGASAISEDGAKGGNASFGGTGGYGGLSGKNGDPGGIPGAGGGGGGAEGGEGGEGATARIKFTWVMAGDPPPPLD